MRRRKISSLKTQIGYLICVVVLGIILACGYSVITVTIPIRPNMMPGARKTCLKLKKLYGKIL